ncbi:MAG: hypothetical protein M1818_008417 [Claussenomyces sp. TS43310]|nr:MAG: hypothetical protein M1818_008417 [Claussenomyces sp. TS43310]
MESNSCLVTGGTGFLGRQVVKAFKRAGWKVAATGFTRSGAANRFPDKCDLYPEGTRALNVEASRSLAKASSSRNILLVYISTDYVFAGTEGDAPYEVTDTPKPSNLYGETKYAGEQAVLVEYKNAGKDGMAVVLRVPVLYGDAESAKESAVNVLMDAVWKVQEEDVIINMDHWAQNILPTPRMLRVSVKENPEIAEKYLATPDKSSLATILHFSSEDKFTKYEICQVFADIMGLSLANVKPNTQGNDLNANLQRPYDCHLSTKALEGLGISVHCNDFRGWWRRECRAARR